MNQIAKYLLYIPLLYIAACASKAGSLQSPPAPALPVVTLQQGTVTTWQEYPATVQGTTNVEIRPQVSGYLEKIFIEDGAWVSKGQPLFRINSREYTQFSEGAAAAARLAKA